MIKVTDYCDPEAFTPLELEGLICYTRLFLETVFRESHQKVCVNIHVKPKQDALYPETGGFTEHKKFGEFDIVIFKNHRPHMLATLSHELIHVKQFMEDGFKINKNTNKVYWEGRFYLAFSEILRMQRAKEYEIYNMLPWEFEANTTIPAIIEVVTEKLRVAASDDAGLKNFLKLAMEESSY